MTRYIAAPMLAVLLVAAALALHPSPASAAAPPGQIAYTAVSPDGSEWQVRVVDADGTGARTVYSCSTADCQLAISYQAWDPTGRRIAVERWTRRPCTVAGEWGCISAPVTWVVIDVESGSSQTLAPPGLANLLHYNHAGLPFWSPDGRWFAFSGNHVPDPAHPSNVVHDAYVVGSDGGGQSAVQLAGVVSGWTPNGQVIVLASDGTPRRVDPSTGATGLLTSTISLGASVSPNSRFISLDGLGLLDNLQLLYLDGSPDGFAGAGSWSHDSSELAYTRSPAVTVGASSLPGPHPVLARAPAPRSAVRVVVPAERAVGYVSWGPHVDRAAVAIDTPVTGQAITGHESTTAEQDAVRLTGSVSSRSAPSGWCFAIQAPSAPAPAAPSKADCNRPFESTSASGGRTTARFKADIAVLVGTELLPGENTVWVWGYDSNPDPEVARVTVRVGPNYYVKHVEVAQAISPVFGPLGPVDPLKPDPYALTWRIPSVSGFPIPLIAGRSTLLRIYVGDSTLEAGKVESASVHYRVTAGTTSIEGDATVDVTAVDRQPDQQDPGAAVIVRVPGAATLSGATIGADVEVGREQAECRGCFPNGNRATVGGIAFEQGGELTLAPVPIALIGLSGSIRQPDRAYAGVWTAVADYLPIRDGGVAVARSPGSLVASVAELNRLGDGACAFLLNQVKLLRAVSTGPAAERWVGMSSPTSQLDCLGMAYTPGASLLLTHANAETLAHELGHSLGLDHTLSLEGRPPDATPLPYAGIGGVGYEGTLPVFRDPLRTNDLMSYYSGLGWTSPATWWRMHQGILGRVGTATPARASASGSRRPGARTSRRLVSGYVAGGQGAIFSSLVANAGAPDAYGPPAGRVVALDAHGREIAASKITGTPLNQHGASKMLPFLIALPPTAKAASLQLRAPGGARLATLRRSRHAPSGRFVRLPRRARPRGPLTVRWVARDRDGGKLSVVVLARRGKGRWKTIAMGPGRARTSLRPRTLGAGRRLRLRMLVSDGFRTRVVAARAIRVARG